MFGMKISLPDVPLLANVGKMYQCGSRFEQPTNRGRNIKEVMQY